MSPRRKLLFFVTEDYYFVSHRLTLAVAARAAGYDVAVVTRVRRDGDTIRAAGLRVIPFENVRSSLNPLRDLVTLWRLAAVYRRERPDVVHNVAMKPVLYGSTAARIAGTPCVVNAIAGMGWLFTSHSGVAQLVKPAVRAALRVALNRGIALVQNPDDESLLREMGVRPEGIRRIAGAGVDVHRFAPSPAPDGPAVVLFPARLLWDKGIGEFVAAARQLRGEGVRARFVVAGERDPLNPASVSAEQLDRWVGEGIIEYRGWVSDMPGLMAGSHIVCLPSYREGLPKSLIEGAAAGRAIVTTDVPGCRQVVAHGQNGLLVPRGDASALAAALARLIADPELRERMAAHGRARAEQEFALDVVIRETLALYDGDACTS